MFVYEHGMFDFIQNVVLITGIWGEISVGRRFGMEVVVLYARRETQGRETWGYVWFLTYCSVNVAPQLKLITEC